MILSAPSWSESSPQFTHGFPRRLISADHGGFLPGNIAVTARATNLAIRRLATDDVACLISRESIAGAGFTVANLLNCRFAAVKYSKSAYVPEYLVTGMLRTGVNFCNFERIEGDVLVALAEHVSSEKQALWGASPESDETASWSDTEPVSDLTVVLEPEALSSLEMNAPQTSAEKDEPPTSALTSLLCNRTTTMPATKQSQQPPAGRDSPPAKKSRKRKRSQPSSSRKNPNGDGQGPSGTGGGVVLVPGYRMPTIPVPDGFNKDVLPTGDSLRSLKQFLENNHPYSLQEVQDSAGKSTDLQRLASTLSEKTQRPAAKEALRRLWELCSQRCTCDENCNFKASRGGPSEGQTCDASAQCDVCTFFVSHNQLVEQSVSAAADKNARLSRLLSLCQPIAGLYPTDRFEEGYRQRKKQLNQLLGQLLCCKENRLGSLRHIGTFSAFVPRIKSIQLKRGWSLFWNELRKVAKTVNTQPDRESKFLALTALRLNVPERSNWRYFLSTGCQEEHKVYSHFYLDSDTGSSSGDQAE